MEAKISDTEDNSQTPVSYLQSAQVQIKHLHFARKYSIVYLSDQQHTILHPMDIWYIPVIPVLLA